MRVPLEIIEHEEYTDARYGGRPFTGTAFDLIDGGLAEECDFVEGQLHGIRREYFASGRVRWEAHYDRGAPHGQEMEYFEDSRVQSKAVYGYGELLERQEFTQDGVKVSDYRRETGILREWRASGSLRKETTYGFHDGYARRQVVEERFYDHDGKPTVVQVDGKWKAAGGGRTA